MKVSFVYLDISFDPIYWYHSRKFIGTYQAFPAGTEHELVIALVGADNEAMKAARQREFEPVASRFVYEPKEGWDLTHHKNIARGLDSDFAVFCTSRTYFWRQGWLAKLVEARKQKGEGIYGTVGSYEFYPHLRTMFFGCRPGALANYGYDCDDNPSAVRFEAGENNITRSFDGKAYMVTWDGIYEQAQWRSPANIFRRGDQSNMLAWDKHSDLYTFANATQRKWMENLADGVYHPKHGKLLGKLRNKFDRYLRR
ncbi:MAG TPA: hypothetical protein VGN23_09260 [Verrucomicrobiae bacterium]|jgi:hypothetical protein